MSSNKEPSPPIAKKNPKRIRIHDEEFIDNYFWLRERENPDVIEYLKAENDYTDLMMKGTEALQAKISEEIKGRLKEDDASAPEKTGEYHYYTKTEKDKQYKKYYRKKIAGE
ncbi:MAG: oligopeptidase B, partial [Candidatus Hodarchaeales archaeon]